MRESRESTLSEKSRSAREIDVQKTKTQKDMEKDSDVLSVKSTDVKQEQKKGSGKGASRSGKKNRNIIEIRDDVEREMPKRLRDSDLKLDLIGDDNAPGLKEIEGILDRAAQDTGRAAKYYKVRDAIRVYRANKNPALKISLLLAVRESAFNYLLEKRGNAPVRKQVCSDIVRAVDSYVEENDIPAERNLDYLTGDEVIPDDVIDLEIQLAGKLTVQASESFDGNLKDRRKAFKRKISDVRLAGQISAEIERNKAFTTEHISAVKHLRASKNRRHPAYDEAVERLVADYMNLRDVNERMAGEDDGDRIETLQDQKKRLGTNMLLRLSAPDNSVDLLGKKGHMLEAVFADILSWNPGDFAFKEPGDFLNRTVQGQSKQEHFLDLYYKLQLAGHADILYNEYVRLVKVDMIHPAFSNAQIQEIGARISLYREMKDEYVNRLQMMNSPYYALLLQKDTDDHNTPAKLNALSREKNIAGAGKKSIGAAFKSFIKSLVSKNKRLVSGQKTGGEYARNMDPEKLLKWHRKSIGAPARPDMMRINNTIAHAVYATLENDNKTDKNKHGRIEPEKHGKFPGLIMADPEMGLTYRANGREEFDRKYPANAGVMVDTDASGRISARLSGYRKELDETQNPKEVQRIKNNIRICEEKLEWLKKREKDSAMTIHVSDSMFNADGGFVTDKYDPQRNLFPAENPGENVRREVNSHYITATLIGLANRGYGDYISKNLVRPHPDDETKAVVRLYDEDGLPLDIVLDRTGFEYDDRPLWLQLVEKAAAVVLNRRGHGNAKAGQDKSRGFAHDVPWQDWDKGYCQKGAIDINDIEDCPGDEAIRMLFGKSALKFSAKGGEQYKGGYYMEDYNGQGDYAIGQIESLLDNNRIVLASTCKRLTLPQQKKAKKEAPGCEAYKNNYNPAYDAILYRKEDSNVLESEVYAVTGIDARSEMIEVVSTRYGKKERIGFSAFRRYFTDIRAFETKPDADDQKEEHIIEVREDPIIEVNEEPVIEVKDEPVIEVKEAPKDDRVKLSDAQNKALQNEIKNRQAGIKDAAAAKTSSIDADMDKQRSEIIRLTYLLDAYENLKKKDASIEDAFALRDRMTETIKNFSGAKDEYLEVVPMDKLAESVNFILENRRVKDAPKRLAKQLKELDDQYTKTEDDTPYLDRISKLMQKGDKMTAQDKILAYDYNVLLICLNRSEVAGDIRYNDYKKYDLKYLQKYAAQTSELRGTDVNDDEEYDDLPEEKVRAHEAICRRILSEYTGKDADYFRVIPLEDLSGYAFDVHDIIDKKKAKEAADECLQLAGEIHERIKLIDEALDKNDRAGIIAAIEKLSGVKAVKLQNLATAELKDVLASMYWDVNDPEELVKETGARISENEKKTDSDYCRSRVHDSHRKVWQSRDLGAEAGFDDLRSMAEYSILYLTKHKGLDKLTFDDFSGLSADEIYLIYRNAGVIEGLKESTDPYEKDDVTKAIREMAGMKMSDKLKADLENTLEINFSKLPEYVNTEAPVVYMPNAKQHKWKKTEWQTKAEAKEALKKRPISERERHVETEEHKQFMLHNEYYHRRLDKLSLMNPKKMAAGAKAEEDRSFSPEAKKLLNVLGDIIELSGKSVLDSRLDKKIGRVLADRAADLLMLLEIGSDKLMAVGKAFAELKNGVSAGERAFFEAFEVSFMPVIETLYKAAGGLKGGIIRRDISKAAVSGDMDQALKNFANELEGHMVLLEKELVPVMSDATRDIFDMGDDSVKLVEVTELMDEDAKKVFRTIDEEKKKDRIAAAKTTREKEELKKKSKEQTLKERLLLNDMQEDILYNGKKGQGRFNQLLISGYYENSKRSDQRRMLSYVIRDLKQKGTKTTDKERGCEYFASAMKGAGPLMQKMMQGIPERMVIPELAVALGTVKSSLAPIDPEYVKKVFDEMVKDSNGAIQMIDDIVSLGAASVAETFKCTIKGKNIGRQEVVVKILRPDAEARLKDDYLFVRKSAMFADMSDRQISDYEKKFGSKIVDHDINVTESGFLAQYSEIVKEFDFTTEAENARLGQENYVDKYLPSDEKKKKKKKKEAEEEKPPKHFVKSVRINENFAPKKHYLVMDLAQGVTVDKVISKANSDYSKAYKTFINSDHSIPDKMVLNSANIGRFWGIRQELISSSNSSVKAQKLCADLAFVWVEQALFGSKAVGFGDDPNYHHGDMHAGNIMVDGTNSTVLDYGNFVMLLDSRVNQILAMISSVVINNSKYFVKAFNSLLTMSAKAEAKSKEKVGYAPLTDKQKQEFMAKLDEIFELGNQEDTGKKILIALNIAQSLGIKLPKEIQNFSQCQQRLENTVQEIKEAAKKTARMIDVMDNMNVAPEDMDSFDPLIKLHLKLKDTKDNKHKIIEMFSDIYTFDIPQMLQGQVANANTKEELDELMEEHLPSYLQISRLITADEAKKKAVEYRQTFKEAFRLQESGQKIPVELARKMQKIGSEIQELGDKTYYFGDLYNQDDFLEMADKAFFAQINPKYDRESFEKIMVLYEHFIPGFLGKIDAVYDSLPKEGKEEDPDRRGKVADLIYDAYIIRAACSQQAYEIRSRLRDSKDGEKRELFERHAARFHSNNNDRQLYVSYREAEADYDRIKDSGDPEAVKLARETMFWRENELLYSYMMQSSNVLGAISRKYEDNYDMDLINSEEFMPDFVSVMGDVVEEHWERAGIKLDKKLGNEIRKKRNEAEKLQKQIDKEEAEAKKKEAKAKKKK